MIILTIISLATTAPARATERTLPIATVCEIALRTALASDREIDAAGARALAETLRLYRSREFWDRAFLSDVRAGDSVPIEIDAHVRRAKSVDQAVVAREFLGAGEVARALEHFRGLVGTTGAAVLDGLERRYPPARWSEIVRVGATAVSAAGPLVIPSTTADFVSGPIVLAAALAAERRSRSRREREHGVPRLSEHLALGDRALGETQNPAPVARRPLLSVLRRRTLITRSTHDVLFDRGSEDLGPRDLAELVRSGARLRKRWTDLEYSPEYQRELRIESALFTELRQGEFIPRWMILVHSRRPSGSGEALGD